MTDKYEIIVQFDGTGYAAASVETFVVMLTRLVSARYDSHTLIHRPNQGIWELVIKFHSFSEVPGQNIKTVLDLLLPYSIDNVVVTYRHSDEDL